MSHLERALARLSLQLVTRVERFWQPCTRCRSVRWPWHQHRGVVLELRREPCPGCEEADGA